MSRDRSLERAVEAELKSTTRSRSSPDLSSKRSTRGHRRTARSRADTVKDPLRHHRRHRHLHGAFGDDGYGRFAERVARSLGTWQFLIGQTLILIAWVIINANLVHLGWQWDVYPFILLNLCLSFQAAYAAPLILVAENRQAQRDRASEIADATHRQEEFDQLAALQQQNNELTQRVHDLAAEIHALVRRSADRTGPDRTESST
jgi:uncharacterized membrane protein